MLAGILERKAAEDSLRTSELMKTSILQSLTTGVVVVDGESMVLAQNQTWLQLARAAGCVDISVGSSFLDSPRDGGCRPATGSRPGLQMPWPQYWPASSRASSSNTRRRPEPRPGGGRFKWSR